MNFVKFAKMALATGFVAVSLMGQPFSAHAEEIVADRGDGRSAVCHGVSLLAWEQVDGVSPSQESTIDSEMATADDSQTRDSAPMTGGDDVIVDGSIITGENPDTANSHQSEWKYVSVRRY
jgi:putative intracellular protease/amidase